MKEARLSGARSIWPRKAQIALLRCWKAPQTRSTANAPSVAQGGRLNGTQAALRRTTQKSRLRSYAPRNTLRA